MRRRDRGEGPHRLHKRTRGSWGRPLDGLRRGSSSPTDWTHGVNGLVQMGDANEAEIATWRLSRRLCDGKCALARSGFRLFQNRPSLAEVWDDRRLLSWLLDRACSNQSPTRRMHVELMSISRQRPMRKLSLRNPLHCGSF